jgi:non-specific serine/threonine protein kinase
MMRAGVAAMHDDERLGSWVALIRDAERGLGSPDAGSWAQRIAQAEPSCADALRALADAGRGPEVLALAPTLAMHFQHIGEARQGHDLLAPYVEALDGAPASARASATVAVSLLAFRAGLDDAARHHAEIALELARQGDDDDTLVRALCQRARVGLRDGDLDVVRTVCTEALTIADRTGDDAQRRIPLHCLAEATRLGGDIDSARSLYVESIALNERLGNADMVAMEQSNLAALETSAHRTHVAARLLGPSLRHLHATTNMYVLPYAVFNAGGVLLAAGRAEPAARLFGAADEMFETSGMAVDPADRPVFERYRASARQALGDDGYAAAVRAGRRHDVGGAVDEALRALAEIT